MPENISFSKAVITSFDRQRAGGSVDITASLTETVIKKMKWGDFPEWEMSSKPKGKLAASAVEFKPNGIGTEKFSFELEGASAVRDFQIVRKPVKEGKNAKKAPKFKVELKFKIDFTDKNAARKMEQYIDVVGDATIKATYELVDEDKQGEIELDEARQEATGKGKD